jgi:hypothetical protein
MAMVSASCTKSALLYLPMAQPTTCRENDSRITARYNGRYKRGIRNPGFIGLLNIKLSLQQIRRRFHRIP